MLSNSHSNRGLSQIWISWKAVAHDRVQGEFTDLCRYIYFSHEGRDVVGQRGHGHVTISMQE